jgi:hypothetical protein
MTRRVLAFVLALTIASGAQGSLMYAAAAAAGDRMVADPAVQEIVATAAVLHTQPAVGALAEALTDSAIQCQRGGQHQCFGYFSQNCCAEIAALSAIAGAVGAWLAAGVGAYYYWHYC